MSISSHLNVRHCSRCQRSTEYLCLTCDQNLCTPCMWWHDIRLDAKHHDVMLYREKINSFINTETCDTHPDRVYVLYCETCGIPVCFRCNPHIQHKLQHIRPAYRNKRQDKANIINIRSEILYNEQTLQSMGKSEVTACRQKMVHLFSERSQILKDALDTVPSEISERYKCLLIHKLRKQMIKMTKYIVKIQIYEHSCEQLAYRPVKFLRFIKKDRFPQLQDTPNLAQHCRLFLTQKINMKDLIKLLSEIQITDGGKRKLQEGNYLLLTQIPFPVLQKSFTVKGVKSCTHISCMTPDRVWVSDKNKLILTNTTTGDKLYTVKNSKWSLSGSHTVNSECELIYIDKDNNINKLSNDRKTTTTLIEKPESPWVALSVYCSPSTGDLLVRICILSSTGEVRRYDNTWKLLQTIPHKDARLTRNMYRFPHYMTENNNSDVVVSDFDRVVVTERGGRYRFSYTGHPSGSRLTPYAVCTDALSNILICNVLSITVEIISKDGEFLSYIPEKTFGVHSGLLSLSYDFKTHCLWVGMITNRVSVYRYVNRHLDQNGKPYPYC